MRTILCVCIALCLAFVWACTEMEVLIPLQSGPSGPPPHQEKKPISLETLKQIQKEKRELSGRAVTTRCDAHGSKKLQLDPEQQQTPDWCWAATSKMIIAYHNGKKTPANARLYQIALIPH